MAKGDPEFGLFPVHVAAHQTEQDRRYFEGLNNYFSSSLGNNIDKLRNWSKFVPRQEIGRFLVKNALFQKVCDVHGYIIECGVYLGGGLMSWAQLSALYEPLNHVRRIVGFDTFEGFPTLHENDIGADPSYAYKGGFKARAYSDLQECIRLFDLARPLGHIPRIELVPGNALTTIPSFVRENPHLLVALLYLDFDVYEPTKVALENFLPVMPKGSIIVFDELNQKLWPGETRAVTDTIGIRNLRIQRFPFQPQMSFAVLD